MGSLTTTTFTLLLLTFLVLSSLPTTLTFFHEWGPDLEGPWCAQRPPGQDCCDGRDDYCAVPILGTECYCDIFCNDTSYDCCPDFWAHCHGVTRAPTTARPTTLPPPRTTPYQIVRECVLNGVYYRPGDRVVDNCNECKCELYVSGGQRRYGMQCTDNVCLIRDDLIAAVNSGPYTWRASNYSALWGMTLDDGLRYRLGTYPLESDVLQMTAIKVAQDEALPESFDSRDKWPDKLHPIRDQGNCASSWAFSTTAVASDRLTIESAGAIIEELSAQHMLSCDTDGQDGCTGGKVDRAWYFLRKFGVVTEACYPYDSGKTEKGGECSLPVRQRGGDCPSGIQYKREKRYKASPPYRIRPLEREIMKEILDNGPVQAIFEVKEDFYMYKSGVYQYSGLTSNDPPEARKSAYHSVRLLGWGVERTFEGDIVKYWIGANSWGPEWGENGYFRIARGVNTNDIENYVVGAWGKITGDVAQRQLLTESRRRRLEARGERPSTRRLRNLRRRRRRRHHIDGDKSNKKQLRTLEPRRRRGRNNRRGGRRQGKKEGRRNRNRNASKSSRRQRKHDKKSKDSKKESGARGIEGREREPQNTKMSKLEELIGAL
ncbi:tubulointerstitial nephritis antigen-like [Littorina saxatilis]|uniref:SMB domain-containing protein n=1 Tax=Littorina saxatilis TaxID=31220 RepID=A0AAN9B7R2_9CAEN